MPCRGGKGPCNSADGCPQVIVCTSLLYFFRAPLLNEGAWLTSPTILFFLTHYYISYDRESLVAETQWSSAQEKEMKHLYVEFMALQVVVTDCYNV